jgi:glycopeptide antibiotics resistance protein
MTQTARSRRWLVGGLALYAVAVGVVVFTPVSYSGIVHRLARAVALIPGMDFFGSGWIEFVANVGLFVPLGFLLTLLVRRPLVGAAVSIAISAGIELIQIVIPDRQATVRDVVSNGIGASIGALVAWLVVLRRRQRTRSATTRTP